MAEHMRIQILRLNLLRGFHQSSNCRTIKNITRESIQTVENIIYEFKSVRKFKGIFGR